jgi:hypothetical protein
MERRHLKVRIFAENDIEIKLIPDILYIVMKVSTFYVPKGIIFIFSMLVIGILCTIIVSVRSKHREEMMMNESREHTPLQGRTDFNGGISYYGGNFEQAKVKSYIMIDGRLVDGH